MGFREEIKKELNRISDTPVCEETFYDGVMYGASFAAELILKEMEAWCKFERREVEYTPGGHPINTVTERGFERTANNLLEFIQQFITEGKGDENR